MQKRRFEILLPRAYNDGRQIEKAKFVQTQDELLSAFNDLTLYPGEFFGIWIHEGNDTKILPFA